LGTGGDAAAIQVFEAETTEQVAEWRHNKTPIPEQIRILAGICAHINETVTDTQRVYYSIENNTIGDEIVVSAVQGKASVSAGQFHYESDGWRENNDQRQNIYNLFAQFELSPKTSVQAEFRARYFDHGDLTLFFGKDNFPGSGQSK
jgi:hypothetical protein